MVFGLGLADVNLGADAARDGALYIHGATLDEIDARLGNIEARYLKEGDIWVNALADDCDGFALQQVNRIDDDTLAFAGGCGCGGGGWF